MMNFTLKTTALLVLALFSSHTFADSPWADIPVANEQEMAESPAEAETTPAQAEPQSEPQSTTETQSNNNSNDNGRPATEQTVAAKPAPAPQPAPVTTTQTVQQGDVLNNTEMATVRVLDFPRRGMSTDKVKNELGQPAEIIPSIGQPPISRWVYDDRTVYFEYSTVLHVVAK